MEFNLTTNVSMTSGLEYFNLDTNVSMTSGLQEFSEAYSYIHGYLAIVGCTCGIATNTANIVVLTRPKMTSATNLILTWLAVADLLKMMSYLPVNVHFYVMRDHQLPFPSTRSAVWIDYFIFFINFSIVCHTVALWLVVSLAAFRYVYISFPFGGAKHCSLHRAKIAIGASVLSTIVVCIPNYLTTRSELVDVYEVNDTTTHNKSLYYTVFNADDPSSLEMLNYFIHALLFKIIPSFILTVLTLFLIINMHRVKSRRNRLLKTPGHRSKADHENETNRTTAMLLAVVGLCLVYELPHGVLAICNIFIDNFYNEVYAPIGDVLDMMAILSNSVNFIIYCSMSQLFKETFWEVFCSSCSSVPQICHKHKSEVIKFEAMRTPSEGMSFPSPTTNSL